LHNIIATSGAYDEVAECATLAASLDTSLFPKDGLAEGAKLGSTIH